MPRPPVKATLRLAEAQEAGILRAQLKAHKKKPLLESLKEHIGKMIDRIDPLETFAVIAGTFIVHDVIVSTEKFANALQDLAQKGAKGTGGLSIDFFNYLKLMFGQLNISNLKAGFEQTVSSQEADTIKFDDFQIWAVSFVVAFLLIRMAQNINISSVSSILTGMGFTVA